MQTGIKSKGAPALPAGAFMLKSGRKGPEAEEISDCENIVPCQLLKNKAVFHYICLSDRYI